MFCAAFDDFVGFGDTVEQCFSNLEAAMESKGFDTDFEPEDCEWFECEPVGIRRARWEFVRPE